MSSGERTNDSATRSTPRLRAKRRSCLVLVAHRGDADRDVGQRDALVVADRAALDDQAADVVALDRGDLDGDLAVVDQQPVADLDLLRQLLVGAGDPVGGAEDVVAGDGDQVTGAPLVRPVGELAEPDLRPLQVGEDGDGAAGLLGGVAHEVVHLLVVLVAAVAEVQSGHVHARLDQAEHALGGSGGGPHGADDLYAACHSHQASLSSGSARRPTPVVGMNCVCQRRRGLPTGGPSVSTVSTAGV